MSVVLPRSRLGSRSVGDIGTASATPQAGAVASSAKCKDRS